MNKLKKNIKELLTQDRAAPQVYYPLETVSYFQYSRKERGVVFSNDFHFLLGLRRARE